MPIQTTKFVCPDPNEWEIIRDFLEACRGGALVLSPGLRRELEATAGKLIPHNHTIAYDFGATPDVQVDYLFMQNSYALEQLLYSLGVPPSRQQEFQPDG